MVFQFELAVSQEIMHCPLGNPVKHPVTRVSVRGLPRVSHGCHWILTSG